MTDRKLLLEQLERLAIVLDELMPKCAELVRDAIALLKETEPVTTTLTAVERDGLDLHLLTLVFEIPHKGFNLIDALKAAVADYIVTDEGKATLEYNCGCFNLADIDSSLPRKFCEKYGIKILDSVLTQDDVDWDCNFATD